MVYALTLAGFVPRDWLDEAEERRRAAEQAAAPAGPPLDPVQGIVAACSVLEAIERAEADTLRGRVLLVALAHLGPDGAAELLQQGAEDTDAALVRRAVYCCARTVL